MQLPDIKDNVLEQTDEELMARLKQIRGARLVAKATSLKRKPELKAKVTATVKAKKLLKDLPPEQLALLAAEIMRGDE